ncbi:MAG: chalcone isomerase family protein [Thermodesulfobacteriota bacterium]
MRWRIFLWVMWPMMLAFASAPGAAEIEVVRFADRVSVDGERLTLQGTALLRHMVFIRAYVGAFYLKNGITAENALAGNVKRQLVLHYFHGISAEDFAEATRVMIEKNVTTEKFEALKPKIKSFNRLYRDVEPGDAYTATYVPGTGTELALNGKRLGVISGAEFSTAFFSIWLGENPIDKNFRDRLLGIQ